MSGEQLDLLADVGDQVLPRTLYPCGRCGQPAGQPARVFWATDTYRLVVLDACAGRCGHHWQESQRLDAAGAWTRTA